MHWALAPTGIRAAEADEGRGRDAMAPKVNHALAAKRAAEKQILQYDVDSKYAAR